MKNDEKVVKYQLNLENLISIVRKYPDLTQKKYTFFFADNGIN